MHKKNATSTAVKEKKDSQKISFDQLQALKHDPINHTSASARPSTVKANNRSTSELPFSKIPRNVNFYRHLISTKDCNEKQIEWVLKLRSPQGSTRNYKPEETASQPFSLYGKDLEGNKEHKGCSELDAKNELHQVTHLFFHRSGPTASKGSVQFETGLRSYGSPSEKLRTLEKTWRNIPKKDRNEFPKMYPSYKDTEKIKLWSTKNLTIETHSGFEGYLGFPKYTELYTRQQKNVSSVKHLLKNALMSTADWQLSMRNYEPKQRVKTETQDENNDEKALGNLKKTNRKPTRV